MYALMLMALGQLVLITLDEISSGFPFIYEIKKNFDGGALFAVCAETEFNRWEIK